MLHAYAAGFDGMENLEKFFVFLSELNKKGGDTIKDPLRVKRP